MEIHIGRLIGERIKEVGMTKAEFGRRINTSRQNVNTLLRKESLDTLVLRKISQVLNYDFFRLYLDEGTSYEYHPPAMEDAPKVSILIELTEPQKDQILEQLFGGNKKDLWRK